MVNKIRTKRGMTELFNRLNFTLGDLAIINFVTRKTANNNRYMGKPI